MMVIFFLIWVRIRIILVSKSRNSHKKNNKSWLQYLVLKLTLQYISNTFCWRLKIHLIKITLLIIGMACIRTRKWISFLNITIFIINIYGYKWEMKWFNYTAIPDIDQLKLKNSSTALLSPYSLSLNTSSSSQASFISYGIKKSFTYRWATSCFYLVCTSRTPSLNKKTIQLPLCFSSRCFPASHWLQTTNPQSKHIICRLCAEHF